MQATNGHRLLLTVKEARRQLAIGHVTIYKLINSGALRSVKIGAARRIPAEALREYVDSLTDGGEAA